MRRAEGTEVREKVIRVEEAVAMVLRVGVVMSLVVIVTGMLLSALHHPKEISPTTNSCGSFPRGPPSPVPAQKSSGESLPCRGGR